MMAAGIARENGADVTVFEKNSKVGRKLAITGKGRCNLTNNCTPDEFITNVPTNPRFLYGAVNSFSPADTISFFEKLGVPLKTERGNRVFPVSDKSYDIVDALKKFMHVKPVIESVNELIIENGCIKGLKTPGKSYYFDAVIVCTGGKSYPLTGSTGDGYKFAARAGHTVTELKPSLVPLEITERECAELQGLSLKNISLDIIDKTTAKSIYRDFGEMMFTHFGVTGPVVLSASSHITDMKPERYLISIDLKPALDIKTLDNRLLSDFDKCKNKDYANALSGLLPGKLISVFVKLSGINPDKKVNAITRDERQKIINLLKQFTFTIKGFRPIEEAIITSGGVCIKEINPKTMESKLVHGLYFAGEILDVDAYTGGFNLQIAFSTAVAAARAASTGNI